MLALLRGLSSQRPKAKSPRTVKDLHPCLGAFSHSGKRPVTRRDTTDEASHSTQTPQPTTTKSRSCVFVSDSKMT